MVHPRWYTAKRGGTLVAAAAAAAADLRRAHPKQHPAASHSWHRITGRQLAKPLVCAVCFEHIQPDGNDVKVRQVHATATKAPSKCNVGYNTLRCHLRNWPCNLRSTLAHNTCVFRSRSRSTHAKCAARLLMRAVRGTCRTTAGPLRWMRRT